MQLVTGGSFHLWWERGHVVADAASTHARQVVSYLNGEINLPMSHPNEGGTDSHWTEPGRLQSEDHFLLNVGSLVGLFEFVYKVELLGTRLRDGRG